MTDCDVPFLAFATMKYPKSLAVKQITLLESDGKNYYP